MKRVAIVGSGISALACAVVLQENNVDFTIFEKSPVPGGKIITEVIDGFTIEGGPDSFLPEKHWSVDLIKKVKLTPQLLPTNDDHKGTYIFSKKRLHRLPEGIMLMVPTMVMPLLQSSLISWHGKIRMGMELFVPKKDTNIDESLAQFVTRRLGKECLEKIAEPLVAGIHTSNPDNMSVNATFPRFLQMEQKYGSLIRGMTKTINNTQKANAPKNNSMTYFMSLEKGMQQLIDGCINFIGSESLHTLSEVVEIRKLMKGFEIYLDSGPVYFDFVVLAASSYVSAELLRMEMPVLAELLSEIQWSSTATISMAFRKPDILMDLPGFGFLVPRIEGRRINAATWSSEKWSHRSPSNCVLIRIFVGGGHHEELVDSSDEDIQRIIIEELQEIVGISADPLFIRIYRWQKSMPRYTVGHLERIAAIDEVISGYPGLFLIGSSYKGIGIGDCVKSGFDAAQNILNNI
jgi:protoporphyrinogen/coproporphyrinogen III oxidase